MLTQTLIKYCHLFLQNPDKDSLRISLESSPFYPSLLSVMQALRHVGLETKVGKCDWEILKTLESPFLLHMKSRDRQKLLIAKWYSHRNCLKILNPRHNRWELRTADDINNHWDGIVIYTETPQLKCPNCKNIIFIFILVLILTVSAIFTIPDFAIDFLYYIPLILGWITSYFLYSELYKDSNHLIYRLCHISYITDCNRVDDSKYSSIAGLKLNCLVLSFFTSQAICGMLGFLFKSDNALDSLYLIATISASPIILYSIYGQYRIKHICPLCIIAVICLVAECIIFISKSDTHADINFVVLFSLVFITLAIIFQYIYNIKCKEHAQLDDSINYLKLKRKETTILSESRPVGSFYSPIAYGDKSQITHVTTIISPNCRYCQRLVSVITALYMRGLNFRWDIIIGQTTHNDQNDVDNWIECYYTDKKVFFENLTQWCNKSTQLPPMPSDPQIEETEKSAIKHSFTKQIAALKITGFPQIILNDRLLSPIYKAKDIEFLIIDKMTII